MEHAPPLFADRDARLPEARLAVSHLNRSERVRASGQAINLDGKAKFNSNPQHKIQLLALA